MRASTPHELAGSATPNVVVVDPAFDAYKELAADAREGRLGLHFRSAGQDALRLARHFDVDAWIVGSELDDMAGEDFVRLLEARQGDAKVAMVSAGGDAATVAAISLEELSELIGLSAVERRQDRRIKGIAGAGVECFVRLPVSVGAAVIAFAVLALG